MAWATRRLLVFAFALQVAAVALMPAAAMSRGRSPRYAEYHRAQVAEYVTAGPGGAEPLNPAGRMALALAATPLADACASGFVVALFGTGVLVCRGLARRNSPSAITVAVVFALGCLCGAILMVADAADNLGWGFHLVAVGHLLLATGLVVGGLSTVQLTSAGWDSADLGRDT
jgi:hypothetical protein